jgi:hypothetical protein
MAYCNYRNRHKFQTNKKRKILNTIEYENKNENKTVQFDSNIRIYSIPKVTSLDSVERQLLWYSNEEYKLFYNNNKMRNAILKDVKKKSIKLENSKSNLNLKIFKNRNRSNSI